MNPIYELLAEHEAVKTTLKILKRIGEDLAKSGKIANPEHLAQLFFQRANDYTTLLGFHIDKENNVLFPMAEKHLPGSKLKELQKEFDKIETDKIGAGKHEVYHKMLDSMTEIYLQNTLSHGR